MSRCQRRSTSLGTRRWLERVGAREAVRAVCGAEEVAFAAPT